MSSPLKNILRKKYKETLFTTPSHGQSFFIFHKFRQFYKYDISETDIHNPQEALRRSEERAKKIYGTASSHYLTNGSTSGIIASILACTENGDSVLIWDNAHPCHLNAVKLACCDPVFYDIPEIKELGISGRTAPETIEQKLKTDKIKAVIVTSPTYEGFVSNIKKIKEICKKYNAYLIVDEAHGALYPFSNELPESAVKIADFTVQSLHKTAGGLNPTALLHCNCKLNPQESLDMINTTSPSYPLLASIESNINFLNSKQGKKKITDLITAIKTLGLEQLNDDPTKILIKAPNISKRLYNEFGIEDEKSNEFSSMLLCGIGTDLKKIKRLQFALKKVLSKNVTNS